MIFFKQYIPVRDEMSGGPRRRKVPEAGLPTGGFEFNNENIGKI